MLLKGEKKKTEIYQMAPFFCSQCYIFLWCLTNNGQLSTTTSLSLSPSSKGEENKYDEKRKRVWVEIRSSLIKGKEEQAKAVQK